MDCRETNGGGLLVKLCILLTFTKLQTYPDTFQVQQMCCHHFIKCKDRFGQTRDEREESALNIKHR